MVCRCLQQAYNRSMKTTIFAILFSLFSFQASATVILSSEKEAPNAIYEYEQGLGESGFFRANYSCYMGNAKEVCQLVSQEAEQSVAEYSDGGHGYFEMRSCAIEKSSVKVSYERITDYGNEDVELTLKPCPIE